MSAGIGLFVTACNGEAPPPQTFTVRFSYAQTNITIDDAPIDVTRTVAAGGTLRAADIPDGLVVDDYIFLGWFAPNSTAAFTPSTVINANITLYAIYEEDEFYDSDAGYFRVTSARRLAAMANNLDGSFKLTANLTLAGWTPVGTPDAPFTGELFADLGEDGEPEFSITSLTISETVLCGDSYFAALIGYNGGTLRNIVIQNLDIDVSVDTPDTLVFAGGLAGDSSGIITNSRVFGKVVVESIEGIRAGMAAGRVIGTDAIIEYSVAESGFVKTIGDSGDVANRAGGLVGTVENGATVSRSSAHVDVTAFTSGGLNTSAAGLAGHTLGGAFITQSFATGDILAESLGGGTVYAAGLSGNTSAQPSIPAGQDATAISWVFEFVETFATGKAIARTVGNAYASGLIARIDNSSEDDFIVGAVNVLIKDSYSTGSTAIERNIAESSVTAPVNPNNVIGALVGRIQSVTGSVITIENSFVFGDVTNTETTGNNNWTGYIVGRSQNNGTRHIINSWAYEGMDVTSGRDIGIHFIPHDPQPPNLREITAIGESSLVSAAWQINNLDWDDNVWAFNDGVFPTFAWSA